MCYGVVAIFNIVSGKSHMLQRWDESEHKFFIFPHHISLLLGMGRAEVTPVETKTSVTQPSRRGLRKRSRRRRPALWVDGDRVCAEAGSPQALAVGSSLLSLNQKVTVRLRPTVTPFSGCVLVKAGFCFSHEFVFFRGDCFWGDVDGRRRRFQAGCQRQPLRGVFAYRMGFRW